LKQSLRAADPLRGTTVSIERTFEFNHKFEDET
jgi:hypothetical protein